MCDILTGRLLGCKGVTGGIKTLYVVTDGTNNLVLDGGDLTLNGTDTLQIDDIDTSITVFKIDLPRNTGSFTETINSNIENGTVFFQQEVTISLHKLGPKTSELVQNMARSRTSYFVLDNNDNLLLLGYRDGAEATAGNQATGTARGDMSGYTLTLTSESLSSAYHVKATGGSGATGYPFDAITTPANVTISSTAIAPSTAA